MTVDKGMKLEIPDWVLKEVNKRLVQGLEEATCTKHPISAVLWSQDGFFVSGANGPPQGFKDYCIPCPRLHSPSGEDMHLCPAIHGEMAAILNAAKEGTSTKGGALFISCGLPCKDCMKEIIKAGVSHIISPYPLKLVDREDKFRSAESYNFKLAYEMMKDCGVEYIHEPRLMKEDWKE